MSLPDSVFNFLDLPKSGIAEPYGRCMFTFLRHLHAVYSGCTIAQSHQQRTNILLSAYHDQRLLLSICLFFYNGHTNGCEVLSHRGFDLHFPDN